MSERYTSNGSVWEEAQWGKSMGMKRDQRGFTIVELLIAVAILSIVIAAVCGFILVGSRSYAAGNSDISVQQEAQLALNQMSDVMIDTTRSVNYVGYDAGGSPVFALKDAEFTFTPEEKSLIMYNGVVEGDPSDASTQTVAAGNGNKHYHFYWSKTDETLYYTELDVDPANDVDTNNIHFPAFDPTDPKWVELAGHVTDFSVDLSQVEEKRVVQLALTFLDGTKEYVTSNNVTIRNKVGVNDAELSPLNKKKTLSVTPRDSGVVIEPGETYHFSTPKVTGENVADRSVTWSVASAESIGRGTDFTDKANGILYVAEAEPAGTIDIVITTNAVDSNNQHASCTVPVNIKRVTSVNLSIDDAEGTETDAEGDTVYLISPGKEYTITADVRGNKLGEDCSVCDDDLDMDKAVGYEGNPYGNPYPWIIHDASSVEGATTSFNLNDYVDIIESKPYSAKIRVKPNVPDDGSYGGTLAAMSILSTQNKANGRTYHEWVPGAIKLKIAKGKKNISLDPGLRWGAVSTLWIEYNEEFNKGGQGYFLICARVRELDSPAGEDKIMIFRTIGWNTLITPDLFGVTDISKPWYISLQAIDPGKHFQQGVGPSEQLKDDLDKQIWDPVVKDVIADYLANSPDGTYNGKYPHTDKLEAQVLPPEILYKYGDQKDLAGELHLDPVSILEAPQTTLFSVSAVHNTRGDRDGESAFINDHLKFSVYKEKEGGGRESIYVYKQANGTHYNDGTKNGSREGNASPYGGILKFGELTASQGIIKLDDNEIRNNPQEVPKAPGRYQIVPTIQYHNNPSADTSYTVYYANYQPWYWHMRVYEVPESTVYYELLKGGNLQLWSHDGNNFTKGEIYFPTPSSAKFSGYFDRGNSSWQNAKKLDNFTKTIIKGGNGTTTYQPSSMKCRYVPNSKEYELELFYDYRESTWNRLVEVSAGIFKCAANGDKWTQIKLGDFDSQLENGNMNPQVNAGPTADVDFWMWGTHYQGQMYIPLPSDRGFVSKQWYALGFDLKKGAWQTKENVSLKYLPYGQQYTWDRGNLKLSCYYDAGTDEYTMQLWIWENNTWQYTAAYKCKSDGNWWTKI